MSDAVESPRVLIVRHHRFGALVFIGIGLFCLAVPFSGEWISGRLVEHLANWTERLIFGFWIFFSLGAIAIGIRGFIFPRDVVIIERRGIWHGQQHLLAQALLTWGEIEGAKHVTGTSPEGEHDAVILGLKESVPEPGGPEYTEIILSQLERLTGESPFPRPLLLSHDDWDWQPAEFAAVIERCLKDEGAREELGEYSAAEWDSG